MKKDQIEIGGTYLAKVGRRAVTVRIDRANARGGWEATSLDSNKKVRIKDAGHVTGPAKVEAEPEPQGGTKERCSTARCKGEPEVTYLGKGLCKRCWEKVAGQGERSEAAEVDAQSGTEVPGAPAAHPEAPVAEVPIEQSPVPAATEGDTTPEAASGEQPTAAPGVPPPSDTMPRSIAEGPVRKRVTSKARAATGEVVPKAMSCLDAAAAVLKAADAPMQCKGMIEAMAAANLWSSNAPTPAATLYSAILREIDKKGSASRFKKTERGHFMLNV